MDWTRLDVDGRVTALRGGACAGVARDGTPFVSVLGEPRPTPYPVDDLSLDSFGVVGVSSGDATWLTGRGSDGQLHLWSVAQPGAAPAVTERSVEALETAAWAAPALDSGAGGVLSASVTDGDWRVRVHALPADAAAPISPRGRELRLGSPPDQALSYTFRVQGTITVAGAIGDGDEPGAAAWVIDTAMDPRNLDALDWKRVHLAPTPSALSSAATTASGRRTWVAGRVEAKPVAYEVLSLPFRGRVRTTTLVLPVLTLSEESVDGSARPIVLVEGVERDHPVFLAATSAGNRLCWSTGADGKDWQACLAPDGRLHAACLAGGRIHALVGSDVWSLPDPTAG